MNKEYHKCYRCCLKFRPGSLSPECVWRGSERRMELLPPRGLHIGSSSLNKSVSSSLSLLSWPLHLTPTPVLRPRSMLTIYSPVSSPLDTCYTHLINIYWVSTMCQVLLYWEQEENSCFHGTNIQNNVRYYRHRDEFVMRLFGCAELRFPEFHFSCFSR